MWGHGAYVATRIRLCIYFRYVICCSWIFKVQQKVVDDLPDVIKHSVGAGVGFFIALIGLKNAGLVTPNSDTLVALGDLGNPEPY